MSEAAPLSCHPEPAGEGLGHRQRPLPWAEMLRSAQHDTGGVALWAPSFPVKRKVFAYITHGHHLLLFRHPDAPEAGIQAPGGTVGPDEDLVPAVLREAREETGLRRLEIVGFLGETLRVVDDFPDEFVPGEVHHRFFFHLRCHGDPPAAWRHYERFGPDGDTAPIAFDFFWVPLPDGIPELIADQGVFLPRLWESLGLRTA